MDDDNNDVDAIYVMETVFMDDEERTHRKYYIGTCVVIKKERLGYQSHKHIHDGNITLLNSCIRPCTFFSFPYNSVCSYLDEFSIFYNSYSSPQILQIVIKDDMCTVVVKTFWLRWVQRCWKRVFNQKQQVLNSRKSLKNQLYFEQNGKWRNGGTLPDYAGCIYSLSLPLPPPLPFSRVGKTKI
jgi:hypothetical protein